MGNATTQPPPMSGKCLVAPNGAMGIVVAASASSQGWGKGIDGAAVPDRTTELRGYNRISISHWGRRQLPRAYLPSSLAA